MAIKELVLVGRPVTQNIALLSVLEQELSGLFNQFSLYNDQHHTPTEEYLYLVDAELLDDTSVKCLMELIEQNNAQTCIALFNVSRKQTQKTRLPSLHLHGVFFADDSLEALIRGIKAIQDQEYWIPRNLFGKMLENKNRQSAGLRTLTNREIQILLLITDGRSNQEIASALYISNHTVKTHIYNLYKKIGVKSRMRAAIWAERNLSQKSQPIN